MVFLLQLLLGAYLLCLFGRAIFSWVEPYPRNRIHRFLFDITEPVIAPVRKVIPPIGGFDVAYLIVSIGVYFLLSLTRVVG
jgi:YggT family protein